MLLRENADGVLEVDDSYVPHSRLADAKIPMGATLSHIYMARAWRLIDAERGAGFARRARIRARNAKRKPLVWAKLGGPEPIVKPYTPTRTVPPSHKGRAA